MLKEALFASLLFFLPLGAQSDTTLDTIPNTKTNYRQNYKQDYKQEQKQPQQPQQQITQQKQKQHKLFSIGVGTQFLSYEPPDQLHETIEDLYNNLGFKIKRWSRSYFPYIKAQISPTDNLSFEFDYGFLVFEDMTGSGRVNTILGNDTLYRNDIYVNTSFKESFKGLNIKYYLNTNSGRIYFGLGGSKISKKLTIEAKMEVYDGKDGTLLAFYDGTHNYAGESYQINTLFGVEIPLVKGLNVDFFINYIIEGKCTAKLVSKVEVADGLGATFSEERIDEKKGTSCVGLGMKYDLPFGF